MPSIKIHNVIKETDAAPLVATLQNQSYMNLDVGLCPALGSLDVYVQTLGDHTEAELTEMVMGILAHQICRAGRITSPTPLPLGTLALEATEYSREDGVAMFRNRDGSWTVRSVAGPAWFWDFVSKAWVVAYTIKDDEMRARFQVPRPEALAVLETVALVEL
jgi:hypothetical protein